MARCSPPLHYLLRCSRTSLEAFELARLNRIANLRKEFDEMLEQWVEAEVEARLSRWILEMRRESPPPTRPLDSHQALLPFPEPHCQSAPLQVELERLVPPGPAARRLKNAS